MPVSVSASQQHNSTAAITFFAPALPSLPAAALLFEFATRLGVSYSTKDFREGGMARVNSFVGKGEGISL